MRTLMILSLALLLAGCGQPKVEPEFGAKVRTYLLEHPELLIEMSQALEKKQAAERLARVNRGRLEHDKRDQVLNPNGKVTVVEFFDYNCGYCKQIGPEVLAMAEKYPDVRFVFKDMVIFGEASEYAAAGASLAKSPQQYAAIHKAFMLQKPLTDAGVDRILTDNGLSPAKARARQAADDRKSYLDDVHRLASELGIEGTPAFIIQDTIIPGARQDLLEQAIADARAGKRSPFSITQSTGSGR